MQITSIIEYENYTIKRAKRNGRIFIPTEYRNENILISVLNCYDDYIIQEENNLIFLKPLDIVKNKIKSKESSRKKYEGFDVLIIKYKKMQTNIITNKYYILDGLKKNNRLYLQGEDIGKYYYIIPFMYDYDLNIIKNDEGYTIHTNCENITKRKVLSDQSITLANKYKNHKFLLIPVED